MEVPLVSVVMMLIVTTGKSLPLRVNIVCDGSLKKQNQKVCPCDKTWDGGSRHLARTSTNYKEIPLVSVVLMLIMTTGKSLPFRFNIGCDGSLKRTKSKRVSV